uniref:Uncharacterized protein n=1 Tax=Arundo donax TaxID=35708 RepID=A0A0A9GXK3_ARUDO
MQAFTNFLPVEFLRDKNKVLKLVEAVDPLVRAVDGIAGERISMSRLGVFKWPKYYWIIYS